MMKRLYVFLILALGALLPGVVFASDCQKIVQAIINHSPLPEFDIGTIQKKFEKFYLFSNREIYPSRSIAHPNIFGVNIVDVYYSESYKYTVQIHSFEETHPFNEKKKNGFYREYFDQVEENIDFVLSNYAKRRDWSEEFLKEVRLQAINDADRTSYIVVKKHTHEYSDQIWATIKIIRSKENNPYEEILPVEKALNIRLPFNNGFKFEPGNFVVEKDHYKEGMAQLLIHLSRFAKKILNENPQINNREDLFYTYADRKSSKMYKSLGFKAAKGFEDAIVKDGQDWWVLSISGNDLANLPERIKNSRNVWTDKDEEIFKELTHLFDSISADALVERSILSNSIESKLNKRPDVVIISQAEPHLNRGTEVQKLGITFDKFGDDGDMKLPIPTKLLPLKEGSRINFRLKEMRAIYKKGTLFFDYDQRGEKVHFELTIDSSLRYPKKLIFYKVLYGETKISFIADFN
ncbi:MAG: hypothetical protein KBD76_14035 [Bacteriovorax sp.]|nr:hypothetical protein [Bacteriovorax sp.]